MINDNDTISSLIRLPKVIIKVQQAFLTRKALEQITETALQNIKGVHDLVLYAFDRNNKVIPEIGMQTPRVKDFPGSRNI